MRDKIAILLFVYLDIMIHLIIKIDNFQLINYKVFDIT